MQPTVKVSCIFGCFLPMPMPQGGMPECKGMLFRICDREPSPFAPYSTDLLKIL